MVAFCPEVWRKECEIDLNTLHDNVQNYMNPHKYLVRAYKIWWDGVDDLYVGCTRSKLSDRMTNHRFACRRGRRVGQKFNVAMKKHGVNSFNYVLLGTREVHDRDEQRQFEQEWIDELQPNLNSYAAFRSAEYTKVYYRNQATKWLGADREPVRSRNPGYKAKHKKKLGSKWQENVRRRHAANKIRCHCGGTYNVALKHHRTTHFQTIIHQAFVREIAKHG